jgi:hypothetical protein
MREWATSEDVFAAYNLYLFIRLCQCVGIPWELILK